MERLTARCGENIYFPKCMEEPCNGCGASAECDECEFDKNAREKLAEYENTGLTPEEITQLIQSGESKEEYSVKLYNQLMETEKEAQEIIASLRNELTEKTQWTDLYFGQLRNANERIKKYEEAEEAMKGSASNEKL